MTLATLRLLPAILLPLPWLSVAAAPVDFGREVRPIFEAHCYKCHGPEKQKSGYRLDLKHEAFAGGDEHAPNILPGKGAASPLFRFVSGADAKLTMPPKSKGAPLSVDELSILKRWLDEGALWPDAAGPSQVVDRADWWSFKPLHKPAVPESGARYVVKSPIDAFIAAKLAEKSLPQAGEADPRTLIRRLSIDLIGLPPTPEDVAAFEKECQAGADRQAATERLVDRLLDSPHYGERWARHWLDVVHYGETHGYDKDKPRPNAWPYRDYVIRALNGDKPYARFVEEQLAGDVLYPGTVDGIVGLGFIAAGPWDYIGHAEVPETKIDGKVARHLDRDDMIQTTMGSFCSLTVGCAQCHNHKFDPITQEDYYSLQAVFAALDRAEKPYFADAALTKRYADLKWRERSLKDQKTALEAEVDRRTDGKLAALDKKITAAANKTDGNTSPEFGYHSGLSPMQDTVKWVQVDLGREVTIDKVVLSPCYDNFNGIGAGFGYPVRFKIEAGDDAAFLERPVTLASMEKADVPNPGTAPQTFSGSGTLARYVRVTATKLALRKNDYMLALAELQVFDTMGQNAASGTAVSALDSIEAPPRWRKSNLVDSIAPVSANEGALASLRAERATLLGKAADPKVLEKTAQVSHSLAEVSAQLARFPKPNLVYAGTVHYGSGAFSGTGSTGGKPRLIQVLKRGDVKNPGQEVGPGSIAALAAMYRLPSRFQLPEQDGEGARRAALAHWITDEKNPLTWRSIVNRIWQHHFGRPLVDTPNDFGRMGALPAHPELLDWLAVTFRDDLGGSIKKLHKLIVMSHVYQQATQTDSSLVQLDPDNKWLSHQNRSKLDAECVRDATLFVSGKLDLSMGGPSFQDFVVTHPEHSPHYEYELHDPEDTKCQRRSIYRFIVRSQQQPFMTTLDCADPSMRVDKRNESLSPLQALAMMNDGLMVVMAKHFAERVEREVPGGSLEARIARAFQLALLRSPNREEETALRAYAKANGLPNACRIIFNLNEFSFVD